MNDSSLQKPKKIEPTQTLFENFFEFSPDAIVVTDENGRIMNVNSQAESAFGYTRAELRGLPVEILIPERFRAAHPNHRESYSAHPSVRPMGTALELYGRRKDGSEFPVDVMLSPVETAGGQIFLSVIRDVSERKRAEDALRQSEQQLRVTAEKSENELRQIIDAIPQQVFVLDADWNPLFANRLELEYTGLTPQEFQSKDSVDRIFHPEDLKKLEVLRERALADGAPFEIEARIRGKGGQYRWFLIRRNPLRDAQGRVLRWYGTRTDIEDRKRAEEQASAQRRDLRQLVDAIPQQVFVFDADWSPLFANRRELEYTGLTPQEAQSKDLVARIFHRDDLKELEVLREQALADGAPFEMEARIRGKDGEYRWFLIRDNPLRDAQGRVLRWYGTRTDIEDRKRAEEGLSKAQADLAHVTRIMTMGELAASIAHEVNQPISGIVINGNTCLRWLAGDPPNLEEAREAARRIVRDGKRAGDVIARIRALATKTVTAKARLDMNEVIREVVALARDEMRRNSVTPWMELADDLSPVSGDRVQLQQVVLNLVMNGVQAMSAVEERRRELVIRTQNDEAGQVRVTVHDSGIGLGLQNMEQIYDAFYTTKHGGMGMGLSISRSIVK
ncbi:MAG TPA: PAS domain S-box protein, partial [Bryobacteraceae bacterium]|nr:PAS domain S-box protein [Bryobacteraceae bacterium]